MSAFCISDINCVEVLTSRVSQETYGKENLFFFFLMHGSIKNQYFFYIFKPPIVDMFFKKIATYDKIKFPQQANNMVGGTRRNCADENFFLQIKPKIILILIQLRQK